LGRQQINRNDFPGNPPITLRFVARNGVVRGSFSRDDRHFEELPLAVSVESLGPNPEIGLHGARSIWGSSSAAMAPRFLYFHQDLGHLDNYR
jgi:hypothetical protein